MKFLPLIWTNFVRNRARLTFTLIAVVSAFALYGMLAAIGHYFVGGYRFSTNDRIFIEPKVTDRLPYAYVARVSALPEVLYGRADYGFTASGYYQSERNPIGLNFLSKYFAYPVDPSGRFVWDPEQFRAYTADRTGALANETSARLYGWKVGDVIPITIPGLAKADGSHVWTVTIRGLWRYTNTAEASHNLLVHYEYLDEGRATGRGTIGFMVAVLKRGVNPAQMAGKVDELFMNSAFETESGTQDSLRRDYFKRIGNVTLISELILLAVFASMMLVTGSSLLQNFAERTREFGTLKALGYASARIGGLVVLESTLLMLLGGTAGLAVALAVVKVGSRQWDDLRLSPEQLLQGVGLMVATGVVVGLLPAIRAHRLLAVEALQGGRR
ncbi:MAG TPA: FtsX-like permease family protein [Steroidobacteraceae bacterium]|nr:FtsX-like permease family protein [Steroidobacteraceae bacterium]